MTHSYTFGNWGTAAGAHRLPACDGTFPACVSCVLPSPPPIESETGERGQTSWCSSGTVLPPSMPHAPGCCAHRAGLKAQRHGYSSETALSLPCRDTLTAPCAPLLAAGPSPTPPTAPFPCLTWYSIICYLILAKKRNIFLSRCSEPPQEVFALLCLQISSHLSVQPGHSSPPDVNAGR